MGSLRGRMRRVRVLGPALMGIAVITAMLPSAVNADTDLVIGGDGVVAYANGDSVRLRTAPGYDANTIDYIPEGTAVIVKNGTFAAGDGSVWYQVSIRGETGYMDSAYLASSGALYIGTTGTAVTNDSVNLRSGPSTGDRVVATVPAGASVTLTGDNINGWLSVGYNGAWGYIYGAFLGDGGAPSPARAPAPTDSTPDISYDGTTGTRYTSDALNLRSGPGTDQGVIAVLPTGTAVSLTGGVSGTWVEAGIDSAGTGWVSADYLTETAPVAPADSAPAPAQPQVPGSGIVWPLSGGEWEITQGYHGSSHINADSTWQYDYSFDLARTDGNTAGRTVYSPVNGTIRWFDPSTGGISIDLGDGYAVAMFHTDFDGGLQVGQAISQGQYLGMIGSPGTDNNGGFPHLHLTVWATDDGGNWSRTAAPFSGQHAISGVDFPDDGTYSDHSGYVFYP